MGRADQPKVQEIVPEVYQLEIASDLIQEGVQQDVVETAMLPEADIPEVDRPETDIPDVSDMPDEDERYPELQVCIDGIPKAMAQRTCRLRT